MTDPEQVLDQAVESGAVPFAVAMTASSAAVTGSWTAGDAAAGRPAAEDTVFRIYPNTAEAVIGLNG